MTDDRTDAVQRLVDVLQKENEALKRLDFPAAVALVTAKQAALAELAKPQVPPTPASMAQRLVALAAENRTLLERAITVQTRIVQIIARAAVPPPAMLRYNGHGGRTAPPRSTAFAVSTRA